MGKEVSAAAEEAVEEAKRPEIEKVELSNGVCLRIKKFPPFLIRQAVMRVERPRPPKITLEGRGEEENPDDPVYQAALQEYEEKTTEIAIDAMFVAGTEFISVPDGIYPPDQVDNWAELLNFLDITVDRDNRFGLYLAWLKLYALSDPVDMANIMAALATMVGLSEKEVDQAVDSFRSRKMGRSDNGVSPADPGDRDNVPPNRAQRRAGGRRKRSS